MRHLRKLAATRLIASVVPLTKMISRSSRALMKRCILVRASSKASVERWDSV
jgi:hypothetical protein